MKKVHLLIKKEEIDEEKMATGSKVAVVLDVLLATSTITAALYDGAKEVLPVLDSAEALEAAKTFKPETCVVAGELNAKPLDGFVYPSPRVIREQIKDKTLILSTTNGTVALRKSAAAKKVYIASLLNNSFVAQAVNEEKDMDTIVVVCSGNSGELSLEDLYGGGHFISCLLGGEPEKYDLTDSAKAALSFYEGRKEDAYNVLLSSRVGSMFGKYSFIDELEFAASKGKLPIVPVLYDGKAVRI